MLQIRTSVVAVTILALTVLGRALFFYFSGDLDSWEQGLPDESRYDHLLYYARSYFRKNGFGVRNLYLK